MSDTTATTGAPALPGDGLREGIVADLRRHLGEAVEDVDLRPNDDLWVRIATASWRGAGEALLAAGFEYFCFLSAIDWLPSPFGRGEDDPTEPPPERSTEVRQGVAGGATRLQVFARVTDVRRHVGVTLKVDVPDDTMTVESWSAVYAGANWHERETHEMFGIGFAGHPDLRNMYLPLEFEGHPLRKDFPLLARIVKPWPGIVDVEPMPNAPPQDEVVGDVAPVDATPDQADGGIGVPPAEDAAAAEALDRSVEEAPDFQATPPGDVGRTDAGAQQDLLEGRPDPAEVASEAEATEPAEPAAPSVSGTTLREEAGDELVPRDSEVVDESEVRRAEGDAVTEDEAMPSGRGADDETERETPRD